MSYDPQKVLDELERWLDAGGASRFWWEGHADDVSDMIDALKLEHGHRCNFIPSCACGQNANCSCGLGYGAIPCACSATKESR